MFTIKQIQNYNEFEKQLANILYTNVDAMKNKLKIIYTKNKCLDDQNFEDKLNEWIDSGYKKFDKIPICHLSKRIDIPKGITSLNQLLFTTNSFSTFLKGEEIEFTRNGTNYIMKYKTQDFKILNNSGDCNIQYIWYRLVEDSGISGFCFAFDDVYKKVGNYYNHLYLAPELINKITDLTKDKLLVEKYNEISKYYLLFTYVEVSDIKFDKNNSFSLDDKMKYYLNLCLRVICNYYIGMSLSTLIIYTASNQFLLVEEYTNI